MEGHKRPNGSPICPSKSPSPRMSPRPRYHVAGSPPPRRMRSSRSPPASPIPWIPGNGKYLHRRNPNWVEPTPPSTPQPLQRQDTEISLVATEIDDDHADESARAKKSSTNKDIMAIDGNTITVSSSRQQGDAPSVLLSRTQDETVTAESSRQPSTSSHVSRTFTEVLLGSRALASVFSTPPKNAAAVSLAARKRGLYAGFMTDSTGHIQVKDENPFDPDLGSSIPERNLIVVGQDASAVEHLLRAGEDRLLSLALDSGSRPRVGAYPVNPNSIRPTFIDIIIAGAVGGLIVLWVLSSL